MNFRPFILCTVAAATTFAGCTASKSENPLSPSVAGPIPGVSITAPKLLTPDNGSATRVSDQPLMLMVENASTSGQRPLSYAFEVGTDEGFSSKVFSRAGVEPGSGRTSIRLPDALAGERTYYWRARAEDGANTGPYSGTYAFNVYTPVSIDVPQMLSPIGGVKVSTLKPEFIVRNADRSGPVTQILYQFEVSENSSFTADIANLSVPEQASGATKVTLNVPIGYARGYFWHVRAYDSNTASPWSAVQSFVGPDDPTPPPPPPPPPGNGGGNGGNWTTCGSTPGEALVACVHAAVNPARTTEGAFEVTKRVAWLLRGGGAGLLIKNGGENIVSWQGYSFSASRICYPNGHIYKVLSDVGPGGANGPSWSDNDFVDPALYVKAIDPSRP